MLTQWKLSDSPPESSKLQDSIALHFTPSHSTPSGLTSINRPAMINEPVLHRSSPAPKASPAPRASPNPRNSPAPPGGKRHPSPKIHLPAPMPTEDYLNRAAKIPERLDCPQRPLLVLDLNGTLVYRPDRDSTRAISRPFLQPFLKYIFENFYVMVWSSAKPYNVSRMVNAVLTFEQHSLLIAQWGRDKFDLTPDQYTQNVQVYKELSRIWAEAKTTCLHPQHNQGQLWGQHNTILLDDSEIKASSEPFNLIQIPEFVASEEQMHGDVLREVAGYLDEVRMQNDVSAFMKRTPFKADGRWNMEWPDVPEGVAITA
ncbi:HAD-like protein [Cenococcum geophilum]